MPAQGILGCSSPARYVRQEAGDGKEGSVSDDTKPKHVVWYAGHETPGALRIPLAILTIVGTPVSPT